MGDGQARLDFLAQVTRAIVSLSGLGGITFLGVRGRVDPAAIVAIYSTVLSLYGAAVLRHAQAGPPAPPSSSAESTAQEP